LRPAYERPLLSPPGIKAEPFGPAAWRRAGGRRCRAAPRSAQAQRKRPAHIRQLAKVEGGELIASMSARASTTRRKGRRFEYHMSAPGIFAGHLRPAPRICTRSFCFAGKDHGSTGIAVVRPRASRSAARSANCRCMRSRAIAGAPTWRRLCFVAGQELRKR